jgi:hypothetical protein
MGNKGSGHEGRPIPIAFSATHATPPPPRIATVEPLRSTSSPPIAPSLLSMGPQVSFSNATPILPLTPPPPRIVINNGKVIMVTPNDAMISFPAPLNGQPHGITTCTVHGGASDGNDAICLLQHIGGLLSLWDITCCDGDDIPHVIAEARVDEGAVNTGMGLPVIQLSAPITDGRRFVAAVGRFLHVFQYDPPVRTAPPEGAPLASSSSSSGSKNKSGVIPPRMTQVARVECPSSIARLHPLSNQRLVVILHGDQGELCYYDLSSATSPPRLVNVMKQPTFSGLGWYFSLPLQISNTAVLFECWIW